MKNVKDQVYAALTAQFENVSDLYPKDWTELPAIQFQEEDNRSYERTTAGECKSYVRYLVNIWDTKSTSEAALQVDEIMSELGLVRTACQDVPDPSGMKHKSMRYEAIIDLESDTAYWPQ